MVKQLNLINSAQATALNRYHREYLFLLNCSKKIFNNEKLNILVFGCSFGEEPITLSHYFPEAQIDACDVENTPAFDYVKKRFKNSKRISVLPSNSELFMKIQRYDIIIANSVLCINTKDEGVLVTKFPFSKFEDLLTNLSGLLKEGGIMMMINSSYSPTDSNEFNKNFKPLSSNISPAASTHVGLFTKSGENIARFLPIKKEKAFHSLNRRDFGILCIRKSLVNKNHLQTLSSFLYIKTSKEEKTIKKFSEDIDSLQTLHIKSSPQVNDLAHISKDIIDLGYDSYIVSTSNVSIKKSFNWEKLVSEIKLRQNEVLFNNYLDLSREDQKNLNLPDLYLNSKIYEYIHNSFLPIPSIEKLSIIVKNVFLYDSLGLANINLPEIRHFG